MTNFHLSKSLDRRDETLQTSKLQLFTLRSFKNYLHFEETLTQAEKVFTFLQKLHDSSKELASK